MAHRQTLSPALCGLAALVLAVTGARAAEDPAELRRQVQALQQQNAALQEQLRQQQEAMSSLARRLAVVEETSRLTRPEPSAAATVDATAPAPKTGSGFHLGNVHISGEGGVAFLHTQPEGMFPNAEFRVEEAKLFVEAPVWENVYFFAELNLATREYDDLELRLGELSVDFENVSQLWGRDRQLNVRAGRMDIPFGEEYHERDAIDNPLISHSLSDLWGVDEGVELYGTIGRFGYAVAVQNGGVSGTRDYTGDKSVACRLAFDPASWLHLSVSAMRTGDLDAMDDFLSEMWFGNGWFRSIGGMNTTEFNANLVEGDIAARWPRGHLKAFGGCVRYDDNDPDANNQRDLFYYSVEAMQRVTPKFYAAARFSQIFADDGYPLVGHGEFHEYFFEELTAELWRLSLGLGWRFSDNLLFKTEYTIEGGEEPGGERRERVNFFAAEVAFRF